MDGLLPALSLLVRIYLVDLFIFSLRINFKVRGVKIHI